jgi:serine phosphatase RsbU (regulator of sigma subunit)
MPEPAEPAEVDWLGDVGADTELGRRIRELDWSATSLGPIAGWPTGLRTAVRICLASSFPMLVVWGPDLVKIYNDGYRTIMGSEKHPGALGRPVREVWPEIWDEIGPMFEQVVETGQPTWTSHGLLVIDRFGYPEAAWFTWGYSPLFDDDGSIGGVLDIVVETTEQVLAQRRLQTVTDLGRSLIAAESVVDAALVATASLARWTEDVRAADVYVRVGSELALVASNRRAEAAPVPAEVLREVAETAEPVLLGQQVEEGPAQHAVMPLGRGEDGVRAVLVASLQPLVRYDQGLELFLALAATSIGSGLDSAARRDRELGEHRIINETLQAAMITPIVDTATVAARYVPAVGNLSVGGDWYDLVELEGNRRALIVGDCVGHGLAAATAMGQLRSAARAMVLEGRGPASVLEGLDRFAGSVEGAACATLVVAIIDRNGGTITYSRAGHLPPLLCSSEGPRWLDEGLSTPLAVVDDQQRAESSATMGPDDVLVLFTDGLVERRGETIDDGLARLAGTVGSRADESVVELADRLVKEMADDGTRDDIVVVVKRLTG